MPAASRRTARGGELLEGGGVDDGATCRGCPFAALCGALAASRGACRGARSEDGGEGRAEGLTASLAGLVMRCAGQGQGAGPRGGRGELGQGAGMVRRCARARRGCGRRPRRRARTWPRARVPTSARGARRERAVLCCLRKPLAARALPNSTGRDGPHGWERHVLHLLRHAGTNDGVLTRGLTCAFAGMAVWSPGSCPVLWDDGPGAAR